MRLGGLQIEEPLPELKDPHALAVLRPWIDAGNACTLAITRIEEHFGAVEMGRLARPGNFYDFTRYRPVIYWKEGNREITIPNTIVKYVRTGGEHDFVFLHLLEPHMFGEYYSDSVTRLLIKLGVRRYCLLGSMYDMVPHTRPLLVSGGAGGLGTGEALDRAGVKPSYYEGPVTICHLISQGAAEAGIETMNFMAHLPQYTELDEDFAGRLKLMEVLHTIYGTPVEAGDIEAAEKQQKDIDAAVNRNSEIKEVVTQLEAHYDARAAARESEDMPQLAPDIEDFLKEIEKRFRQGS